MLAQRIKELTLTPLRRHFGRRIVNWTPEFMGFGNQLYLWVWAHVRRDDEIRPLVLSVAKTEYWAGLVPDFRDRFLVTRDQVRLLDQRTHAWAEKARHSGDPRGFTDADRADFVRTWLLPAPLLDGIGTGPLAEPDAIVINVRRGDYFTYPHAWHHAFDVESYLRLAVPRSIDQDGPARRIHLVSDDIDWCRSHLDWLTEFTPELTLAQPGSPREDLVTVAGARRLVITNSSFSLWAAMISNTLYDNHAQVWVPAFFQRRYGPGRCIEYDPSWSFVDELPGPWQPDWLFEEAR